MAILTSLPPSSRLSGGTSRRHSDPSKGAYQPVARDGKSRASSSAGSSPGDVANASHREAAIVLPSVPEDTPMLPKDNISPDTEEGPSSSLEPSNSHDETFQKQKQQQQLDVPHRSSRRDSKRLSWIPNWTFAGSAPVTPPTSPNPDRPDNSRTSSMDSYQQSATRMSRFRNSISTLSEVVLRDTEPTHESNFPANPSFPDDFAGQKLILHVYGTLDAIHQTPNEENMRLQTPRGFKHADLSSSPTSPSSPSFSSSPPSSSSAGHQANSALLLYILPLLHDGDLLVQPFVERHTSTAGGGGGAPRHSGKDSNMATVIRGAIQDCVFKCFVVGVFPLKVFFSEEKERVEREQWETYELDVELYDSSVAVAGEEER